MKHFSKQLSWLLAFVLIFTNLVFTGMPVSAASSILIDESTDAVLVTGTDVSLEDYSNLRIRYYDSDVSNTALYEDNSMYGSTIGIYNIAIKPYAWHIKFVEKVENQYGTGGNEIYCFKAYPDTSLENLPASTTMTFPEGTTLNTTGTAINVSVYVGTSPERLDYSASCSVTLPSASELQSLAGQSEFGQAMMDYNLPTLTRLFYTVELTDKSASAYSMKLTLVPTVQVIFNENSGTPSLTGAMYATPYDTIDSTKLPTVSLEGADFYGWKVNSSGGYYVYKANVTDTSNLTPRVSSTCQLKAMYKERNPTFKLDLTNKKVTGLKPNRTYAYPKYDWDTGEHTTLATDANGEFSYNSLQDFESLAQLKLNSTNQNIALNSDYISLKNNRPTTPVVEYTTTTARVTNTSGYIGVEFAISATSDYSGELNWGASSSFSGLTPETEYKIYAKHNADENGFESDEVGSVVFTTPTVKAVSNESTNGITIAAIPDQTHTGSAIEPTLLIKDGDKTLVQGTDYTVAYTNNTNAGTATANVTFVNEYSGTMTKDFNIVNYKLVSFAGNGGSGTMPNVSVIDGQQYTLPACTFTAPANKEFKAWNIGGTEYAAGAILTITTNTTVTAVWRDLIPAISPGGGSTTPTPAPTPTYTVMFNTDGGSTIDSKSIKEGSTIGQIPAPTKDGYVFDGWYSDKELKKPYDASTKITASTTLYAKWTKIVTKPDDSSEDNSSKDDNSKNELVLTIGKKDVKAFGTDKALDSAPIIKNSRTMLPVRFIAESLGAEVTWNGKKREVTIKGKNEKGEDVTIILYIDSDIAYVNGKKAKLDSPAFIENGRTFTPLRFVAENLGANVEWIREEQKVVITKKDN